MSFTKAHKGDLAILETRRRECVADKGRTERTEYEIVEITSCTRHGLVKTVRPVWQDSAVSTPLARWTGYQKLHIVPQDKVDVAAVLAAARAHAWPGHPNQPKPYDTLAECRELIRAHLVATVGIGGVR